MISWPGMNGYWLMPQSLVMGNVDLDVPGAQFSRVVTKGEKLSAGGVRC